MHNLPSPAAIFAIYNYPDVQFNNKDVLKKFIYPKKYTTTNNYYRSFGWVKLQYSKTPEPEIRL